jgi:flagellar motility protein MotE (MotC chaperone)
MRILPHSIRVLPLTLIVAGLLLVVKVVEVASVLGDFPIAAPIAEARAEATRPQPAASRSPPASVGSTESATPADAAHPEKTRPLAQVSRTDAASTVPSPQEVAIREQLAGRRQALDTREQEMERKGDLLRAAETRLDQKLQQMRDLESSLARLIKADDEQQQAKLRSLVKIYENMKPKDAARIFEELDMDTLLPVVERMNERKLAPVMAEMNPGKAKEITQELSKRRQVTSGTRPGGAG